MLLALLLDTCLHHVFVIVAIKSKAMVVIHQPYGTAFVHAAAHLTVSLSSMSAGTPCHSGS
jgi:hypothetical protein